MTPNDSREIISGDDICYQWFGEDVDLLFFHSQIKNLDRDIRDLLYDVAVRLKQLNATEEPSLKLYLLCTCFDRLNNPHWLSFNDWLITKKRKHSIEERDKKFQSIDTNSLQISSSDGFQEQIKALFNLYLKYHGTGRKFEQLFLNLPDSVKELLCKSYIIVSGSENFFEPATIEGWYSQKPEERLKVIASYLYKLELTQGFEKGWVWV